MILTLEWTSEGVRFIDQTKLPLEETYVLATSYQQVADVIVTMVVRGAPAIGVSAAFGIALGAQQTDAATTEEFAPEFAQICTVLAGTRPTAVNLFWAIDRMKALFAKLQANGASLAEVQKALLADALAMYDEDIAACKAMGAYGAELMPDEGGVLTHCNAGALATCGYGTALGVIRGAVERGKQIHVFADETRPFLQGARLTAWELMADGIPTTVLCDNMAASLMRQGKIQAVVVGADRIAANGDVANKIGTYSVAILAKEHGIPFYVAAPWSTIDRATKTGDQIPIEERSAVEVTHHGGTTALRKGLAETLALLGARPEMIQHTDNTAHWAERIVRKLLDGQGWLRWSSLSDVLPLLAEAAPDAFLGAVEKSLNQPESSLSKLFVKAGHPLFSPMPQVGLLWALEVISWDRERLPRVSLLLAALDERIPNNKSGSTPFRSLSEIFMSGFPQTTAPVEERVRILKKLMQQHPAAGWRLLVALLPNQMAGATEIHRPSWRDWALPWSERMTNNDFWHQVSTCAELLVEAMGDDVGRWKTLIEQWENLPEPINRQFLNRLNGLAETATQETRREVSDTIRGKVTRHKRFANADWALNEGQLAELEAVQRRFEPKDAIRKHAWLFRSRWQVVEAFDNDDGRMEEHRLVAVREILEAEGWEGILRLVEAVDTTEEVGATVAALACPATESRVLPSLLATTDFKESESRFVTGYLMERFRREGWVWLERLDMTGWSDAEIGRLLLDLPFERKTWQLADSRGIGVSEWYWKHTGRFLDGKNLEDALYAIGKFQEYQRASAAFSVIRMVLHQKHVLQPSLLMDVLQSWLDFEMPKGTANNLYAIKHELNLVFNELQKAAEREDEGVDINRLAKLEWACLTLLDGYPSSPVILHRILRDDPRFFVEVLAICFRPKDEPPKADSEYTEKDIVAAQNGYRLLMTWNDVPGSDNKETIDEEKLLAWVKTARALAGERRLLNICDSKIGEILARSPEKSGETWPPVPVRDTLEEIGSGSDEIFRGFHVGIYNKRGIVSRSPRDGGAQERVLAEKFRKFAEDCKIDWPKTSAWLRKVSLGYEEDAKREDLSVEFET